MTSTTNQHRTVLIETRKHQRDCSFKSLKSHILDSIGGVIQFIWLEGSKKTINLKILVLNFVPIDLDLKLHIRPSLEESGA